MVDNIINLRGNSLKLRGEPYANVVEALRRFLEAAESGSLSSVAIASVDRDDFITIEFAVNDDKYSLLGALAMLQHRMSCAIKEETDAKQSR